MVQSRSDPFSLAIARRASGPGLRERAVIGEPWGRGGITAFLPAQVEWVCQARAATGGQPAGLGPGELGGGLVVCWWSVGRHLVRGWVGWQRRWS